MSSVAPLDRASPEDLTFVAIPRYAPMLATTRARVVLIDPSIADAEGSVAARIVVEKPLEAMLAVLPRLYAADVVDPDIDPTVIIGAGLRLGADLSVGPFTVLGAGAVIGDGVRIGSHCAIGPGVAVGAGTRLHDGVTLYSGTTLGERVIVHSGVRLGSDGFGYVQSGGAHVKIPHVGRCVIEADVEIGANTTIDRGSIDDTVIGAGSKIDNLVHIAHNVRVGRMCLIMAQAGIAGSVRIEDGCILAGQAGIAGHVNIGRGARIAAQAGVFGDIPAGETWSGYPARPHRESLRASAALLKLAGMVKNLERLLEERKGS